MNRRLLIRLSLGLALLGLLFWRIPWQPALRLLPQAHPAWFAAGITCAALSVTLRACRLGALLPEGAPWLQTWVAVTRGYLWGLVLPAGGGEVMKIGRLTSRSRVPVEQAAAAVLTDRLFDFMLVALLVGLAGSATLARYLNVRGVFILIAMAILLAGTLFLLTWRHGAVLERLANHAWCRRFPLLRRSFDAGQTLGSHLRNPSRQIVLLASAVLLCGSEVASTAAALKAFPFSVPVPLQAAPQVALMVMLSFALPLLPAGLGMHQAACLLALTPLGVAPSEALGFSLLSQLGHWILVLLLGAVATPLARRHPSP